MPLDSICFEYASYGQLQAADAQHHPLPDDTAGVWFTDPPYYFAVPYADMSDFFFVWYKRVLSDGLLRYNLGQKSFSNAEGSRTV